MTFKAISYKLIKSHFKQYSLFLISITFSITMIGAYGVLQFSPTIMDILVDGGSTQVISISMFFFSMIGILFFLLYADHLFLKHKSKEVGIFLALGITRDAVKQIVHREYRIIFQIGVTIGMLLSIPVAYFAWSILNLFFRTNETTFYIGWNGLGITFLFSIGAWLFLSYINQRYIRKTQIIKLLKASQDNEKRVERDWRYGLGYSVLIPIGIFLFFTLQRQQGVIELLSYVCLGLSVWGVYEFIIWLASIGDLIKKVNLSKYYKNMVYYNLLKSKISQYTRSIFVATLLITITLFGLGFLSAGFIDGYYVALNEPYDYVICKTFKQEEVSQQSILELAKTTNTHITDFKVLEGILIGKENRYKDGETDWSSRIVISEKQFNKFTKTPIEVKEDTYTLYYDQTMDYKVSAFYEKVGRFYNSSTKVSFNLKKNTPIVYKGLFNSKTYASSFIIVNEKTYNKLREQIDVAYHISIYMMQVEDWAQSKAFESGLIEHVVESSDGEVFENWHKSAVFEQTGDEAIYSPYKGNEMKASRIWVCYPFSKLHYTTTQFMSFATYIMLMLFIAMIAFIASVMVVGIKIIGTLWEDQQTYDQLIALGMRQKEIKRLITKQMLFIYFIPTLLGSMIGAFATYRIILAADVIYVLVVMKVIGLLVLLIFIIQLLLFAFLRHILFKAIK